MKKILIALMSFLMATTALAQKTPFAIEDLYKLKGVGDPQISPDGKKIAFTVTENSLAEGKSNVELYIIDADGTNMRRLTNNPGERWSSTVVARRKISPVYLNAQRRKSGVVSSARWG